MTVLRAARIFSTVLAVIGTPATAFAQSALLQGGPVTPGHTLMYVNSYSQQPVVQDAGSAAGGAPGANASELGLVARGAGTAPYANSGSGPLAEHYCEYDAPTTNSTGYHYLCMDANAQGGGLLDYGYGGGASALPFKIIINGTTYTPPFTTFTPGTFSSLAACASGIAGELRAVSDSTVNTWGSTITGGGADPVLAYCDGTSWTVAAK